MDFGRAFSFPLEDPDWIRKIVITGLISLIPILGWLYLAGWTIEVLRRVLRQDPTPLPDEIDFGNLMVEGLKALVISFVYSLPMILLVLPVIFTPLLTSGGGEDTMALATTLVTCCCTGLMLLYGLALAVLVPAGLANYAATGDLGAAFRVGELIGMVRAAPGAYVLVIAGAIVVGILTSIATAALIIGAFLVAAYGQAVNAHLYAQAYTEARRSRGFAQMY